jgi:hypothetical protein
VKTVGQIIDQIDSIIDTATKHALNPDRAPALREEALHVRRSMIALRDYATDNEKE